MLVVDIYDPWDALSSDVGFNGTLTGIGASWYEVCQVVGVVGLVLSILVLAIKLMTAKSSSGKKVSEIKEGFITKFVIAVALFMLSFIVGTVYSVAVNIA